MRRRVKSPFGILITQYLFRKLVHRVTVRFFRTINQEGEIPFTMKLVRKKEKKDKRSSQVKKNNNF